MNVLHSRVISYLVENPGPIIIGPVRFDGLEDVLAGEHVYNRDPFKARHHPAARPAGNVVHCILVRFSKSYYPIYPRANPDMRACVCVCVCTVGTAGS